jgi:hypothetical protein
MSMAEQGKARYQAAPHLNMIEQSKADFNAARVLLDEARAKLAELDQPDKEVVKYERELQILDRKREEIVIKLGWAKEEAPGRIAGKRGKLQMAVATAERQFARYEANWHSVATKVKKEDGTIEYVV